MMFLASTAYGQSVKLAWDPSSDTSTVGYNVYRSQQSGVYPSTPLNGSNVITTPAFTDYSVQSGTTYYYVVTTVNGSGLQSGYSNQVQAVSVVTANQAPVVSAGPDQTITLPANATLAASATDDGLPNGVLTYRWTVVSGTGVTLSSPTASSTQATFSAAGTYTFRVTVSDGQLSSSDDVIVTAAAAAPAVTTNKAPVVSAGADQTITFPASATLGATASDDGLPNGVLSYLWSVVNGTGVTLSSPTASSTQATFSAVGTYTFRVTVSDGQLSASDDVIVNVQSAPALTLLVSKSGEVLRGAITSIKEYSTDSKVKRLELYIDQNKAATIDASSLTFKWDLRKISGTHTVSGKAYDANNVIVATADLTVYVR